MMPVPVEPIPVPKLDPSASLKDIRPDISNLSHNSSHSRSNSGKNFSTSPGPAAAALAMNSDSKYDPKKNPNNIKAMVAAAALAAAALTPFPLLSHELKQETVVKLKTEEPVETPVLEVVPEASALEQTAPEQKAPEQVAPERSVVEEKSEPVVQAKEEPVVENDEKTDIEIENPEDIDKILDDKSSVEPPQSPEESSYYTDPDSGTIGCVCEYDHDDGFTIQCDRCYRWQHASCMDIKSMDEVPENYLCYRCDPSRKVNKARARETQRDFLMPTSKRKRLNSMDSKPSRGEIVEQVTADTARRKSANRETSPPGKGKKPKTTTLKKDPFEVVDDSEVFSITGEGYKTSYFPLTESIYKDENTKNLLVKMGETLDSRKMSKFPRPVTGLSSNEWAKKLSKNKISVKPYGENAKMKFAGFSKFLVNVETNINEGDIALEIVGEIQLKQDYIDNPFNHYSIWGVAKPKVFFIPNVPFVVDSRYSGNETRFVRRSCNPSCEIKLVSLKDDPTLKFAIVPIRELKLGQEVTVPWEWDASHPILKIISGKNFDQLSDEEKPVLVRSIETVLNGCECSCTNNNECFLYKVRKLLLYLYRSTRKINVPTFGNNLSKYADIYRQKDESYFVPIKQRLDQRYEEIVNDSTKALPVVKVSTIDSSSEDKKDFVIKSRSSILTELPDSMVPYKHRFLQQSLLGNSASVSLQLPSIEKLDSNSMEAYPIPIPILKPLVMNRAPSTTLGSSTNIAVKASTVISKTSLEDSEPARPPVKKKMSLKDYMKSKKK